MDVVTKPIFYTDGCVATWMNGDQAMINQGRLLQFLPPDEPYQVIYVLSARGQYPVTQWVECPFMPYACINGTPVCFLPPTWIGKRVNRYVVPLSAARRG